MEAGERLLYIMGATEGDKYDRSQLHETPQNTGTAGGSMGLELGRH